MTVEEAFAKAEEQLTKFIYLCEISTKPGIVKINGNKAAWLSVILFYARKGLRDQKEPQWIPVSERVPHFAPNKWRRVLVTIEDKDGKRFTSYARYNEELKEWDQFTDWRFQEERGFKVVAWMPQPEPWKGE